MPSTSKSQQRLFGMVHAYQAGKLKHAPAKVREIARHISEEDAEHFAKTRHEGLPERRGNERGEEKSAAWRAGFMAKCAEYGVDGRDLLKMAGPSLRDRAAAGVPGAKVKLRESEARQAANRSFSNMADKQRLNERGRQYLASLPPEERQKFYRDMWGNAIRTRMGLASAAAGFGGMGLVGGSAMEGAGEALASKAEGRSTTASLGRGAVAGGTSYGLGKGMEAAGRHVVAPAYRWAVPKVSKYTNRLSSLISNFANRVKSSFGHSIPDDVKYFQDKIKLPMKLESETAGLPSKGYNPKYYTEGHYNDIPIRRRIARNIEAGSTDWETGKPRITLPVGESDPGTMVHELDHARKMYLKGANPFSADFVEGLSNAERDLLEKTYGIDDKVIGRSYRKAGNPLWPWMVDDIAAAEASATNSEHQFRVMLELKDKLGRNPTVSEFKKYVGDMDLPSLAKHRKWSPNAYQTEADKGFSIVKGLPEADKVPESGMLDVSHGDTEEKLLQKLMSRYNQSDWYKSDPDTFDSLFRRLSNEAVAHPVERGVEKSIEFYPRNEYLMRHRYDMFTEPDLENFRKSLIDLGYNDSINQSSNRV